MAIDNGTAAADGKSRIQADSENGVFGSWWQLAVGMTESSWSFGFGVAQDVRAELRRRTDVTLTLAEEMSVGTFKFVRKLVERVDHVAAESLGRSEAAVLVVTRTLRKAGHGMAELASTTLSDTIGTSGQRKPDALRSAAA